MKYLIRLFISAIFLSIQVSAGPWDPATVKVYSEKIAPGVFVVLDSENMGGNGKSKSLGTSSGFIIGDKGVLVIETYLNARLTGQLIGLIRKETDKPILYAVNTSYHGDHMYGNYLFPNTLIIQHEETKKYVDEKWEHDLQFMRNILGEGKGIEDNVPRTGDILINSGIDHLRIDLGDKIVEIHQLGFGQTEGDIQVWLPEEKIMWIGNPVPNIAPITPWLTEGGHLDSLITMKKVVEFLPEDATLVPGHGRPFKMDDEDNGLTQIIDYLTIMDGKVKEAVEKNIDFNQTARMVAFRDEPVSKYELFNWTHFQINLPCTYLYYHEKSGKGDLKGVSTAHCTHKNVAN